MKHRSILSILSIFVLIFSLSTGHVKGQLFNVGDKDLNFTVGYGTYEVLKNGYRTMLPPIAVSFDLGFRDDLGPGVLSIGGLVGATTYKDELSFYGWIYDYGWKSTTLIGALRGTYHYQLINALDTYGGVHIGVLYESWREYGTAPSYDTRDATLRPVFNLFAGAKFHFSDNLFVLGELGLGVGIPFINIGLGLKM